MKNHYSRFLLVAIVGLAIGACGKKPAEPLAAPDQTAPAATTPRSPSPEGASVSIISPRDGDTVSSPVKVVFGLQGMTLAPAGDLAPNSGHHHLLVDVAVPDLGQPIPKDANHLHFGQAQTETELPLAAGQHTLQLVLGDSNHVAHNPPLISAPISITVK